MDNNFNAIERIKNSIINEKEPRTSDFIAAVVINLIFLYIVNNLLNWNLSFIASSFQDVLWILNLSIVVNLIINVLFIFYHPGWFRDFMQIILNIIGLVVLYFLYTVFPFIFSPTWVSILKFALLLVMLILVLVTIYQVIKLIFRAYIKFEE